MNTDEVIAQLLLWSDLRYVTVEEFAQLQARLDQQDAEIAQLKMRLDRLEAELTENEVSRHENSWPIVDLDHR